LNKLVIAKFGGSTIGVDGLSIPIIIQRINALKKDAKVIAVFSAPLTLRDGKSKSITDISLELGQQAEQGNIPSIDEIYQAYEKILELVSDSYKEECKKKQ